MFTINISHKIESKSNLSRFWWLLAVERIIMDEIPDGSMHPNWIALATVKFKPKIFVKSSGTEDRLGERSATPHSIEIDESASKAYNEILQMPSTSTDKTLGKTNKVPKKRKTIKIVKQKFVKENLYKLALADDYEGIQKFVHAAIDPDINATDAYGWSSLMMASCEGSVNAFQTLLELGADLRICDKKGNTAASLAQKKGFKEILQVIEEYERQCETYEISDDEDDQQDDDGKLFCSDCGIEISKSSSKSHQTSTVHLFSCKFKGNMDIKTFGIAKTNRGYQMMRRTGWDGNSALGATQNGKLYPIKTVLRKNRTGLGIAQDGAKITHFKANDPRAIKFVAQPRALTRKEIHENDRRDKRRDQRLRRELS